MTMMENVFSFKRFRLLVAKHANENKYLFLQFLGITLLPIIYLKINNNYLSSYLYYELYLFTLIATGTYYTMMFFKNWDNKPRAVTILMLPATAFEKMALILFYTVIVFIPVFTFVYYCFSMILLKISEFGGTLFYRKILDIDSTVFAIGMTLIIPYTLIQSFFVLCGVWFKKRQTIIAVVTMVLLVYLLNITAVHWMSYLTGPVSSRLNLTSLLFPISVSYYDQGNYKELISPLILNVSIAVYGLMAILFYVAAYFKLREKEI